MANESPPRLGATDRPRESAAPKQRRFQFTLARLVGAVTIFCVGMACVAAGVAHGYEVAAILAIVLIPAAVGMLLHGYAGATAYGGGAGLLLAGTALFGCCGLMAGAVLAFSAWCAWASWDQPGHSG